MAGRPLRTPRIDFAERPFIVIWEATRACQLACLHCRAEAVPRRSPGELTTEQARALMGEVLSFGKPPPFFVITGGDPFLRPDLFDLVRHGAESGLPVAVSPSGTPALNRANLERLVDAGAHAISLSIDGASAATHDGFRGVRGSFDLTLRGWQEAVEAGLKVQINTTVTPRNLTELPDILAMVRSRNTMTWSLFFLVPTGRGSALGQLSSQQAEDVLHFCYDANQIVSLKTTEAPSFRRVSIQRQILGEIGAEPEDQGLTGPLYSQLKMRMAQLGMSAPTARPRRPPLPINAGRGFVFVSHTGEVFGSGFLPLSAGNVTETPLPVLYRNAGLMRRLRDPDSPTGRCGRCEFRSVCGGSRPRAYGATGNELSDDPLCSYEPDSFGHHERVAALASL